MKNLPKHVGWNFSLLLFLGKKWCSKMSRRKKKQSQLSIEWWVFAHSAKKHLASWIMRFKEGKHQFSPIKKYYFSDDVVLLWRYIDRLMIRLLFLILRRTFKHVIPRTCVSTGGLNALKPLSKQLKRALKSGRYHYFIRFDIKGYYSNIDRAILFEQLKSHYDDPLTLGYLDAIVFNAVDDNGLLASQGIPTRSSLSPFFGSLYLSPLDLAFGSMDVFLPTLCR